MIRMVASIAQHTILAARTFFFNGMSSSGRLQRISSQSICKIEGVT